MSSAKYPTVMIVSGDFNVLMICEDQWYSTLCEVVHRVAKCLDRNCNPLFRDEQNVVTSFFLLNVEVDATLDLENDVNVPLH